MAQMLINSGDVTVVLKTRDLASVTQRADLLVAAVARRA